MTQYNKNRKMKLMPLSVLAIYFLAVSTGYPNQLETTNAETIEDRAGCYLRAKVGGFCGRLWSSGYLFPPRCCPSGSTCTGEGSEAYCKSK